MEKSLIRILIVDDEEEILKALKTNLEMEGFKVETVLSGAEALEKLEHESYQIVLTDINMPEMDGLELLEKIKSISTETTVIMITAYSSLMKVANARSLGASDYILKPFRNLEEVEDVVNRAYESILRWEKALVETVKSKYKKAK